MILEHQILDNGAWLPSSDPRFPPFATESGQHVSEMYILEARLEVLRSGETDEGGWFYAASFPTIMAPRFGGRSRRRLVDRVRRRAWTHPTSLAQPDQLQVKTAEGEMDDSSMGVGVSTASGSNSGGSSSSNGGGLWHPPPKLGGEAHTGTGGGALPVYLSEALPVSAEDRMSAGGTGSGTLPVYSSELVPASAEDMISLGRIAFDPSILETEPSTAIRVVGDVAGACVMAMVAGRTEAIPGGQTPNVQARDAAAQHAAAVASACEELVAAAVASAQAVARELSTELTTELTTEGIAPAEGTTAVQIGAAASPAPKFPEEMDAVPREIAQHNSSKTAGGSQSSGVTTAATFDTAVPSATKKDGNQECSNLAPLVAVQEDASSARVPRLALGTLAAPPESAIAELCPREDTVAPLEFQESPEARASRFHVPDAAAAEAAKKQRPVRAASDFYPPQHSRWHMDAESIKFVSPWSDRGSKTASRKEAEQSRVLADLPAHIECNPLQGLLPSWACCVQKDLPWSGHIFPVDCEHECEHMGEAERTAPVAHAQKVLPDPGVRHRPFSRSGGSLL